MDQNSGCHHTIFYVSCNSHTGIVAGFPAQIKSPARLGYPMKLKTTATRWVAGFASGLFGRQVTLATATPNC